MQPEFCGICIAASDSVRQERRERFGRGGVPISFKAWVIAGGIAAFVAGAVLCNCHIYFTGGALMFVGVMASAVGCVELG